MTFRQNGITFRQNGKQPKQPARQPKSGKGRTMTRAARRSVSRMSALPSNQGQGPARAKRGGNCRGTQPTGRSYNQIFSPLDYRKMSFQGLRWVDYTIKYGDNNDFRQSYASVGEHFANHEAVNHKKEWVRKTAFGNVTTNTVESLHSVMKRQGRNSNVFMGRSSVGPPFLHDKVQELIWRFNKREEDDKFFLFLQILRETYIPQPCKYLKNVNTLTQSIETMTMQTFDSWGYNGNFGESWILG